MVVSVGGWVSGFGVVSVKGWVVSGGKVSAGAFSPQPDRSPTQHRHTSNRFTFLFSFQMGFAVKTHYNTEKARKTTGK
jgi:hypothetical protein